MKGVNFEALQTKYYVPNSCSYFSLGPSMNFVEDITNFLRGNYPQEFLNNFLDKYGNDIRMITLDGFNSNMEIEDDERGQEKHALVIWRPCKEEWFNRGHEEAHAGIFFGLRDKLVDLTGYKGPSEKEELLCDLCGLYALETRGLTHVIDEHLRKRTELLRL